MNFIIKEITDNQIIHNGGKYYYEIDGAILGKARFQATDDELASRMVPAIILPNKQSFYIGDCSKNLVSSICKQGGSVFKPIFSRSSDALE